MRGDSRFGSDLQAPYTLCFMVASLQKLLPLLMKPRTEMSLYVYDYLVVLCFYLIHKSFFFSWIIHTHTNTHTRYTQAPFPCRKFKIHSLIAPSPQTQEPIFYLFCVSSNLPLQGLSHQMFLPVVIFSVLISPSDLSILTSVKGLAFGN